jgi:type VI secretion system protein ImpH
MRLLRYFLNLSSRGEYRGDLIEERVRVRPELSLGFPSSDIASIEEATEGDTSSFLMTARFLGLYGESSPLPSFYTEDLIDEASEDITVTRDFFDIINGPLYHLLFHCWTKYRWPIKVVEEKDAKTLEILFSLFGLGDPAIRDEVPDAFFLVRYLGLFTQFPRSAAALRTFLSDALEAPTLEILPCIPRWVKIPQDQRMRLGVSGCTLGADGFLGEEILDRAGKFLIRIGPVGREEFLSFFPGTEKHRKLDFLTRFFLIHPLDCDVEMILAAGEVRTSRLGRAEWSRLGEDTWLFSGEYGQEVRTRWPLETGKAKSSGPAKGSPAGSALSR